MGRVSDHLPVVSRVESIEIGTSMEEPRISKARRKRADLQELARGGLKWDSRNKTGPRRKPDENPTKRRNCKHTKAISRAIRTEGCYHDLDREINKMARKEKRKVRRQFQNELENINEGEVANEEANILRVKKGNLRYLREKRLSQRVGKLRIVFR